MNNTCKTSEFYCTIKTHKFRKSIQLNQNKSILEAILQNDNGIIMNVLKPNDLKGRPIVLGPDSPTQTLSSLKILKPIVTYKRWFYKRHFTKQLPRTSNYETTLSSDVESLYTSVPIDLGLETILYCIDICHSQKFYTRNTRIYIMK